MNQQTLENSESAMQETITISISKEARSALDDLVSKEGISPDKLVSEAIEEYLFFRRLRLLREQMIAKAQKQGILTDQDVFDHIDIVSPSEFSEYEAIKQAG